MSDLKLNRKQFLRMGASAAALAALSNVLGPVSALAADALSVAWWGEGDQNKRTGEALKAFTAKSGIATDPQGTNFNGYFDRLATQVAGGNPPDVFQVYLANMAQYAARGTAADLGDLLGDGKAIDTSDWSPAAKDSTSLGGTNYFVPLGLSTQPAIIYDKTLLDGLGVTLKPDWTLAEFKDTCQQIGKALSKSKQGAEAFGCDDFGGQVPVLEAFVRSKGRNVFTDDGQLAMTKDDLTEWYELWNEGRTDGWVVPPQAQQQGGFEATALIRGIAPFAVAASSKGLQGFQSLTKNDLNFNPWPRYSGDSERIELVTPVEWMVISSSTARKEDAAKLLSFLVNDEAAITAMGIAHGVPLSAKMRKQFMDGGKLSPVELKIYQNVEDALPHSKPRVIFPAGSGPLLGPGSNLLTLLNQQIAFKQTSVQAAVDRFFSEAARNL